MWYTQVVNSSQPRNPAECLVSEWGPHPKTHRTGYCDHHHEEFARIKLRWRSATNNFRRGQTQNNPGPWDVVSQNIEFTPQPEWAVVLDNHARNYLRTLGIKLGHDLKAFEEKACFNEDQTRTWFAQVEDRVIAMRQAAEILQQLSQGQQPQLPDNPRASR